MATQIETDAQQDQAVTMEPPWITILHNCQCHTFEEVIEQLMKAIACDQNRAEQLAMAAHESGKVVVIAAPKPECERVAKVLRAIGLQVNVSRS